MEGRFNKTQTGYQDTASDRDQVRLWVPGDFAAIALILAHHRANSEWSKFPEIETPLDELIKWVTQKYMDPWYTAYVKTDEQGDIVTCVGANLCDNSHPPQFRQINDWCMWGHSVRDIAVLWKLCKQWGKGRGAIIAQRGTVTPHYQITRMERI